MKNFVAIVLLVWYIHLINGEVIIAKSIHRNKWEPEYVAKVENKDAKDKELHIPFNNVLYYYEKTE